MPTSFTIVASRVRAFAPGIADVGVSSLGNFLLALVGARTLSLEDFGGVQAAVFLSLVVIGGARSYLGDSYILAGRSLTHEKRRSPQSLIGAAVLISVPAAGLMIVGALCQLVPMQFAAVLAIMMPGLLIQDAARFGEHAAGRPTRAVANSAVWTGALVIGLATCRLLGVELGAQQLLVLWAASATLAGLFGCWSLGVVPRPSRGVRWLSTSAREGNQLLGDFALLQATAVLPLLLLGAIAGYEEVGLLRLAQLPLAPLAIVVTGSPVFLQPHLTKIRRTDGVAAVQRESVHVAVYLTAVLAAGVLFILAIPPSVMSELVGDEWSTARPLTFPLGIEVCASFVGAVFGISLRVHQRVRQQIAVRSVLAPCGVAAAVLFAMWFGAAGTAWTSAATATILAASWFVMSRRVTVA